MAGRDNPNRPEWQGKSKKRPSFARVYSSCKGGVKSDSMEPVTCPSCGTQGIRNIKCEFCGTYIGKRKKAPRKAIETLKREAEEREYLRTRPRKFPKQW